MFTSALKRMLLVVASLALAALACAGAEVAIAPGAASISTPLPAADTPTRAASDTPAPLPTDTPPAAYPAAETPTEISVAEATPTPEAFVEVTATAEVIAETPTEAPTAEPSPTIEVIVETPTETPTAIVPIGDGTIPANANFTQDLAISFEAGVLVGRPQDMRDGNNGTWASLRAGNAYWIFDLGAAANVAGVRLRSHSDGNQAVTLTTIEVSADGATWTAVYAGRGECGEPNCDTLTLNTNVDIGFGPTSARYVRLRAGPAPARFAFAEVWVATMP